MEHILIPTDFSTGSLQPIACLAEAFPAKNFTIVLTHVFHTPDSIAELLHLSWNIPVSTLFSDAMRAECKRLKDQYGSIVRSIVFKPVYGSGAAVFRQVLEANKIDTILYDDAYTYSKPHRYSADMHKSLKKAPVQLLKTSMLKKPAPVKEPEFASFVV